MSTENSQKMVRRNVTWDPEIDKLAESLADEYKLKGGVSELARNLIKALAENPERFKGTFTETRKPLKLLIQETIRELEEQKRNLNSRVPGKKK